MPEGDTIYRTAMTLAHVLKGEIVTDARLNVPGGLPPVRLTSSANLPGSVAPQFRLMLSPSGESAMVRTRAPSVSSRGPARPDAAPLAQSTTTESPARGCRSRWLDRTRSR